MKEAVPRGFSLLGRWKMVGIEGVAVVLVTFFLAFFFLFCEAKSVEGLLLLL